MTHKCIFHDTQAEMGMNEIPSLLRAGERMAKVCDVSDPTTDLTILSLINSISEKKFR